MSSFNFSGRIGNLLILLATLFGCLSSTVWAQTGIPPGYVELFRERSGNTEFVYIVKEGSNDKVRWDFIETRIKKLNEKYKIDRNAIEKWQKELPGFQKNLDEWLALSNEQVSMLKWKGLMHVAAAYLARLETLATGGIKLTRKKLDALWSEYKRTPFTKEKFLKAMEKQGELVHKLGGFSGTKQFMEEMHRALHVVRLSYDLSSEEKEAYLQALVTLGGLALQDPRAKVLAAVGEYTIAAIYANAAAEVARGPVDQLLQLGDQRLAELSRLSNNLRKDVDERNSLQKERDAIMNKVRAQQKH
jgi:hypothetical protein